MQKSIYNSSNVNGFNIFASFSHSDYYSFNFFFSISTSDNMPYL